jgi:hypothetical protein
MLTFNQLSPRAKFYAALQYIKGWRETHESEEWSVLDASRLLRSDETMVYDALGNYIGEKHEQA